MACQVIKNNEGKIIDIKDEQGKSSLLFKQIFNTPILTLEESILAYQNTYSEKVRKDRIEKDLILVFETPSKEQFENYQQALINTPSGNILLKTNGVTIAEVNSDTNIGTYQGILNHLTKEGVLRGTRVLDVNGDQIFMTSGESDSATQLTANIVEDILVKQLGASSVTRLDDGNFLIEDNLNTRIINGEKVKEGVIDEMDYAQLKNRFNEETAISIEVERQFEKDMLPSKLKKQLDTPTEIKTEDELTRSIKTLLNKLGIKITSIEDYVKNDSIKNGGVEPSSSALMDMVNKIMAFRDGTITNEDLIEETMHLIEASLPLEQTATIRKNIHNTPEWKEMAAYYYDIYAKEYSGDKLEEMVRREILGKVMANGVATNFALSQDDNPIIQQSIFEQIKAFLDEFFAKVNTYFTTGTQQQIDQLNKDIYVKLLSGELADELDVNQNFGTKFRLYSASTNLNNDLVQIQKQAEKALTILESQSYQIGRNDASQRQQLRSARESLAKVGEITEEAEQKTDILSRAESEKLANAELAATFSYITNVAQKQLTYLQRAVKRNTDNSFHFSSEESAVYNTLITQFDNHILPSIRQTLENKNLRSKAENRILEEVKKVSESIENLKGQVNTADKNYNQILVDLLVKRLDLSADKRAFIEDKVNGLQAETNFFFQNFGSLSHSSNIYLNAVSHVTSKIDHEKRQATLEETLPFVKKLKDAGYLNGKVKDFAKDGFIENRFSDKTREEALQRARYDIYKSISGENISFENFDKKIDFSELSVDKRTEMNREIEDWKLNNYTLSALSPEEMRERKAKLENYSEVTQNYERNSSLSYANLMQNAEIINGVPTFTQDMKYDFEQIKKQRAYDKSVYNLEGELRDGVEYRSAQAYDISLKDGIEDDIVKIGNNLFVSLIPGTNDNASILSVELSKIDNNRIATIKENTEQKEFSPKFVETLSTLDSSEAYDFLMLNSYVGYTNDYYEALDRPSVIDKLTAELGKDNDWKIEDLIQKIATTTKKMNTILQANRVMNNPAEVSYDNMEKNTEVIYVKQYAQDLENYYSQASALIARNNEEIEEDNISETIPNESFRAYMSDKHLVFQLVYEKDVLDEDNIQNIDKIFSEIVDHSTQKNKLKVLELRSFVKDFSNGRVNRIPKAYKRVFKLTEQEYNEMSEEQVFSTMTNDLLQYGYTRLLPYFRKSQPTGVDIALNDLRSGTVTASDFMQNYLEGQYPYLNISPNYNFQQANEQNNKNPHFQQAKLQGTPLFRTFELSTTLEDVRTKSVDKLIAEGKLNKFVNKEFLNEYGIDLVHLFETGEEVATKNIKKFEAREAFIELQKKTLENYGMTNAHNIYQLPQKEKGRFRKIEDIIKQGQVKGVRSILDELINFRSDEGNLGQDLSGNDARSTVVSTIPKFGLRKLKEGEQSDELLETYIWMNRESNHYKARQSNLGDFLAIREALLGSQFENNLAVESSNVYKMLEDQLKFNFFGVKESFQKEFEIFGKRGNWGQVLKSFGKFIRFRNLAYNVTIPITSALSGSVQLRIEKIVGERVDKSALDRANKKFLKEANASMRDVFDLSSDSWMNAVGGKFGFFETEERYKNSNYGKITRGLGRSAYVAHTAANFGINSRVGLAVLSDHRFVDGKLIQYRIFKEDNKGKSDKEVRSIWENYRDIMDVSLVDESGVVYYDYAKIADALNTNMTVEEAKTFMEGKDALIAGRVKLALAAVDQQIVESDKSIAARNSILNFTTIHRSWIYLATQAKFKKKQFSTLSGNVEEGSFITPFRVINQMVKDAKAGEIKNVITYIREKWQNGSETSRKNLIRGVTELSVLNVLVALTVLGFKELDDGDEDSKAFKVSALFTARVANEISSSSISLPKNLFDLIGDTVVGLSTLDTAFDIADLGSSEIVNRGRYSGLTERQRYLFKHVPLLKDYNSLYRDPDGSISSYRFFNIEKGKAFQYLTFYPYFMDEEEK